MRAIVFRSGGAVTLEELPDPAPAPGEIVVAVRASGLCHTDLEILRGTYGSSAFPLVPGHEFAGEVVAVGAGVTVFRCGDRVAVDPNIGCGRCPGCRRGRVNLCRALGAYGVTRHGGLADYCAVGADHAVAVGGLDWPVAALAEPLGCVLNGLSAVEGRPCDTALVFGGGPIGLLMALALRWRGAGAVGVVERAPERLERARAFGFEAIPAGAERLAGLRRGCDLVVDATGAEGVAAALTDYAADGGAVLFFGVCPPSARIPVAPFELFRRQLSLFGTHSLNREIGAALDLLGAHAAEAAAIVTHRLPLHDVAAVLRGGAPAGALKVQFAR